MEIINRRQRMASITRKLRRENKTIAFVPTMGSLHEGHLALVQEASKRGDSVIVSIFVNPTQFNDPKDLARYPRDLASDAAMLAEFGVDYIYAPEPHDIYPEGFATYVYVEGLSESLEGASRPGHFRGVATVVTLLLNTIRPDFAIFGEKDAQQLAIVKRLTRDMGFDTEIISVPTVREPSGLAMSSRNELLSPEDRARASAIYAALHMAENAFNSGERNASKLTQMVENDLSADSDFTLEYVATVNADTLEMVEKVGDTGSMIAVAAKIGGVRLIDNVRLGRGQ